MRGDVVPHLEDVVLGLVLVPAVRRPRESDVATKLPRCSPICCTILRAVVLPVVLAEGVEVERERRPACPACRSSGCRASTAGADRGTAGNGRLRSAASPALAQREPAREDAHLRAASPVPCVLFVAGVQRGEVDVARVASSASSSRIAAAWLGVGRRVLARAPARRSGKPRLMMPDGAGRAGPAPPGIGSRSRSMPGRQPAAGRRCRRGPPATVVRHVACRVRTRCAARRP